MGNLTSMNYEDDDMGQEEHHPPQQVMMLDPTASGHSPAIIASPKMMSSPGHSNGSSMMMFHSNPSQIAGMWSEYPLHLAAATGSSQMELNRLVVHEGYDVDSVDETGSTPLHLAAYFGQEGCVKWLANKGRARYIKDMDGNTAADNARHSGFLQLAEIIDSFVNTSTVQQQQQNSHLINIRRERKEGGFKLKEEALYLELDRAQSKIASLKASEKRARQELEQEIAERVKLFRTLVNISENKNSTSTEAAAAGSTSAAALNALDTVADMRIQILEYKSQRDTIAAEMKLVEEAIRDFETFFTGERSNGKGHNSNNGDAATEEEHIAPSARLRACLRKI